MEKAYQNISFLFTLFLAGILWGFHKTYTIYFPDFKDFKWIHHVHGALMMSWVLLLIVQPIFITTGRVKMHRVFGKASYVTAPLILVSLFLIAKTGYHHTLVTGTREDAHCFMVLDLRGLFVFGLFYFLAMINRKNAPYHMRYMIGTSLLLIGPGVGRGLMTNFNVSVWDALNYTDYTAIAIAGIFLVYDIIKKNPLMPYTVVLMVLVAENILWHYRLSSPWQNFAARFAELFF